MNIKKSISAALTFVSFLASFMFILYGARVAFSEAVPAWIRVFAIVTAGYGVVSIVILMWAWRRGGNKPIKAINYMVIGFLALFVISSMDVGMISGLEIIGIIGVSLALWINWYSVKRVARWREDAYKANTRER